MEMTGGPGKFVAGVAGGTATRRRLVRWLGAGAAAVAVPGALAACAGSSASPAGGTSGGSSGDLEGTFSFSVQNFQPTINIIERAIPTFQKKYPKAKITYTPVEFSDMASKIVAEVSGGSGHDGFHTYTGSWRGKDAATIMMPLTPTLFKKSDLEAIFFPNVLTNVVYSKKNEIFIMPFACGVNGSMLLWNANMTAGAGVDPKSFTSIDQIVQGAQKLTRKEGGEITQSGLSVTSQTNLLMRWILDQGGKFYDEQSNKWTWQTAEAEKALQAISDFYDKYGVSWKAQPASIKDQLGEQKAAMRIDGAYAISGFATSYPDTFKNLVDMPMPAFVAGKTPTYYEHEYSGYAISALHKPDDMQARIGGAFYKELLGPDALIGRANEYSGAILAKGVYTDPRFKDTKFGDIRAKLPDQVISKLKFMTMAVRPEESQPMINDLINGKTSVKQALSEMQQYFQTKEDDARKNMK